jgi:uncharacterized membrane protein
MTTPVKTAMTTFGNDLLLQTAVATCFNTVTLSSRTGIQSLPEGMGGIGRHGVEAGQNAMDNLVNAGRILFAIPMIVFGIQYIAFGKYAGGLPPVPPWAPGGAPGAYLVGIVLTAAGLSMVTKKYARLSALAIGMLFLLCVLFLQLLHFNDVLHNGNDRTRALEPLALSAAAFALAALLPRDTPSWSGSRDDQLIWFGRMVFGISMVIFGAQHFMYAQFLATLVMAWLPAHLFWIYFTGVSMVAAGVSMATNIQGRLAGMLLGLMFFLWVLLLHAPRVFAHFHNQDELTSLFVALAFCGSSLIFAGAASAAASKT